jgi:hypothetical protein
MSTTTLQEVVCVRRVEWTTREDEEGGVRSYEQLVSGDKRIKDT